MCGRYAIYSAKKVIEKFNVKIEANYNVAPKSCVLVLVKGFIPVKMLWSYSPSWARKQFEIINARIETLNEKVSFRNALRCIFLADGYYEWKTDKENKKPYYHFQKKNLLYIAGIYNKTSGCCIVTRKSQSEISHIHHRQPVILTENNAFSWLDKSYDFKKECNVPLSFYQVSTNVNNPKNNNIVNIRSIE
ncbi:SOS response-associated peptidase [Alphaproteobacteria bacterium]|nr:SOS response-associated peptidase [Alphaproteobacteria bacterium]